MGLRRFGEAVEMCGKLKSHGCEADTWRDRHCDLRLWRYTSHHQTIEHWYLVNCMD
jgi:hypothetical protein